MKTTRTISKLLAAVAILAIVLSFASCFGGSLKLESFIVDRSSIKTEYLVGEEIDFSGIKATVTYSDASLNKVYTFEELTITYDKDITSTPGTKEVVVSFQDPNLNVEQSTKVEIKVKNDGADVTEPQIIAQFEKPAGLTAFDTANKEAGTLNYGDAGFESQFAVGNKTYIIGNENSYKLKPLFAVLDENYLPDDLEYFYTTVEISIQENDEYILLTTKAGENNLVNYYNGETLIATVDTFKGEYNFTDAAVNNKIMISVLPSSEYYVNANEFNAITLEANIVKAYNVYEAWELSVIDNNNPAWDGFKYNHGISGVQVSGVVLHANINITANDVPDSFFYTSEKEVIYTNTTTGETKVVPAGTKFLIDGRNVYTRLGSDDVVIEGNFFSINAKQFPLVASPAVFGSDANKNYGSDFSNACLFNFRTIENYYDFSTNTFYPCEKNALITVNNLEFIGNAARDNYVDATENLVSGGGLIFFKATNCTKAYMDNIIGNSGFITYFVDYEGSINATHVKCYDSYQNAGYAWGKSEITFTDSYIYGCGGPIIIAQSDKDVPDQHPVITFVDTVTETHVVGNEIWFKAVGADQLMDDIIALSMGLKLPNPNGLGVGSFVDDQGKMNVISAIIASGTDAQTVITGINAQGSVSIDSVEFSRFQTADNLNWAYIKGITEAAMQTGQIPPFFTVTGADGNVYSIYYNGTTFVDLQGAALGTDASHASIIGAFMTAETITLTQGGLSVTFEFYHN